MSQTTEQPHSVHETELNTDEESEPRKKVNTERAQTQYENTKYSYSRKLETFQNEIHMILKEIPHDENDQDEQMLRQLKTKIIVKGKKYENTFHEYLAYLQRKKTADSNLEIERITQDVQDFTSHMEQTLNNLEESISTLQVHEADSNPQPPDPHSPKRDKGKSYKSKSTRSGGSSTGSAKSDIVLAKSKAKAKAARVRLKYVEKEAEILHQRALLEEKQTVEIAKIKRHAADLNATLNILNMEKEAAAVEAEAEVLQCELDEGYSKSPSIATPEAPLGAIEKSASFVKHLSINNDSPYLQTQDLNPHANVFIPKGHNSHEHDQTQPKQMKQSSNASATSDLTKFLLKKDLLFSRFSSFNDRPEFYLSWKNTFKAIMRDIDAEPGEEIDLLLKWTGTESKKHVQSLKTTNAHDPEQGLKFIWQRLDDRYGSPELVDNALKAKLATFPKILAKDYKKLYDLSDILLEIQSVKTQECYKNIFSYFDSSVGINPIIRKLPYNLQEKWTRTAVSYNRKHGCLYPPFATLVEFINEESKIRNNPSFLYDVDISTQRDQSFTSKTSRTHETRTKKTELVEETEVPRKRNLQTQNSSQELCPIHKTSHSLNKCKAFKAKPLYERRKLLRQFNICYKCCTTDKHMQSECTVSVKCNDCGSDSHATAMHVKPKARSETESKEHGGEPNIESPTVQSKCTQLCGENFRGKSCAKIVQVSVYMENEPEKVLTTYAMIDDQSNRTLGKSALFDFFKADEMLEYKLSTCTGENNASGRFLKNIVVESYDGSSRLILPNILECDQIPEVREEIPTKEVVKHYSHLEDLENEIPQINEEIRILLLIGRDVIEAHHVHDQRIGPGNSPYAQKLTLGWTIIGETCLGKVHYPDSNVANVKKINVLKGNRPTLFEPCLNDLTVSKVCHFEGDHRNSLGKEIFVLTPEDEKPGLSCEDREFIGLMADEFHKDDSGNWSAPLPFKHDKPKLPNNKPQALKRAKSLEISLRKNPKKLEHFLDFMKAIFENGHAIPSPKYNDKEEQWFLPLFGIYHPKKPDQLRAVFDSSAKYDGVSLNDVLLTGPDLTNNLLGILMRFRKDAVAIMADIQQMFYCFKVNEEHRKYLQFLWYRDNDFSQPLTEFMMCVHVFGNSPSPAIATYGLRKAAKSCENEYGKDVSQFVEKEFYVDDGLISLPTETQVVDLIQRTQKALKTEGNLRLHKISSNNENVMNSFPQGDLAKGLKDLDLSTDSLPTQRSLGMNWDLETDSFVFKLNLDMKPYTRRGVLSTINSIYDPLGLIAPIVIEGKILLRSMMQGTVSWDETLPPEYFENWDKWRKSLELLEKLKIPRMFISTSFTECNYKTVHVFSDASEQAIACVAYLHTDSDNKQESGIIIAKAKLAPTHGHTIPRLELCAAVLATEVGKLISEQLHIPLGEIKYYTDSRVILGYICNQTRRFYTYVSNRVAKIHRISKPSQWTYVNTEVNPADIATRKITIEKFCNSSWFQGPMNIFQNEKLEQTGEFELQNPVSDQEIRPDIVNRKTVVEKSLGSHRFERFGNWKQLINAVAFLKNAVNKQGDCTSAFQRAEEFVIRTVQEEVYVKELQCIRDKSSLSKESALVKLDPFLDDSGILRVGGRLKRSNLCKDERNPIIVPGKHWIATLLVRFYHQKIKHQGRHFTSGAVRSAGYWIIGEKRLVSSIIHKCVICRKLRGPMEQQKMSDLPSDRIEPEPPFTSVGVDTFGPWTIVTRKTRGGAANSKRWGIMFTCMSTRGVHVEVVEDISTSSFINALKRFIAIRGSVKRIRSDRGTNFVGAANELRIETVNVNSETMQGYLSDNGVEWIFNTPHSSHMGGSWERMIGTTRRILDSMMMEMPIKELTHEVLVTFLAEVSAIINSRPLTCISSDPQQPFPLSPSLLLTQKPDVLIPKDVSFESKDLYRTQWRKVQCLADIFWKRWRVEFLQSLQTRRKWTDKRRNVQIGDVVLLKDKQVNRLCWQMGIVSQVFPSKDGIVRKTKLYVVRKDDNNVYKKLYFERPVTELVVLLSESEM